MASLVMMIQTVTADESPYDAAGYKVSIPLLDLTQYAVSLGGALEILNDNYPLLPKRLAYRHISCRHENLMVRVLESKENGVILEEADYWCNLCNEYVPLDKLLPEEVDGESER